VNTVSLILAAVGEGRIRGGWEYVWTSYGITWTGLILYAASLWARWPKEERK
jgi:hypothetical protein